MEEILNQRIDELFDDMVRDVRRLVRIGSVLDDSTASEGAPFGREIADALKCFLSIGQKMGFKTNNYDGYAGYVQMGSFGDQVGILAHMDVVPATGNWVYPPFSATVADNRIYGRGSVDDKGPAVACLYGMKAIIDSELPMRNHVRLILGTDEETFARGIHYYLDREPAPAYGFSPDAEFPIIYAEKGIIRFGYRLPLVSPDKNILSIHAGTRFNVVPSLAEAELTGVATKELYSVIRGRKDGHLFDVVTENGKSRLISHGISSHACYPNEGHNAIQGLFSLLVELFPRGDEPLKWFIHTLNDNLKMETDGNSWNIACKDEISGALTCNMAICEVGEKEATVKFDVRYPVTSDGNALAFKLKRYADKLGGSAIYELAQHKKPLYVEKDKPFIRKLQKAYEEATGEDAKLISIGGGTYCRYLNNFVSMGPVFPGQKELAHQENEFLALDDLRKFAKIYAQAIYELAK